MKLKLMQNDPKRVKATQNETQTEPKPHKTT